MKQHSGFWQNKYGSRLSLEVNHLGQVKGKFQTAVGRVETREIWQGTWFEVCGFLNDDLIALSINYGDSKAVGAIVGRIVKDENSGQEIIETQTFTKFSLDGV